MRILIVEDDKQIASYVANGLAQSGFAVDIAGDGTDGYRMAVNTAYDALIVDIMLPGMDGITLIEHLRQKSIDTPLLILSAKNALDDKIRAFQSGGDDYITKPFSFSELLVRVQALIRRSTRGQVAGALEVGDLRMDPMRRQVTRGGNEIDLQPREFALLDYLMRNAGNVVSKTMILEHVWDYHFDPQTNVVDVLMHRLRSKVDREFDQKLLHTVRGVGYVLKVT